MHLNIYTADVKADNIFKKRKDGGRIKINFDLIVPGQSISADISSCGSFLTELLPIKIHKKKITGNQFSHCPFKFIMLHKSCWSFLTEFLSFKILICTIKNNWEPILIRSLPF